VTSFPRCLYAAQPLHAGLVILTPAVSRALQQKLFRAALDELAVTFTLPQCTLVRVPTFVVKVLARCAPGVISRA